jgi:undecaprenyl-diphosphatase
MVTITYFQALVIGLLQGVTELFPISSLGHSVLVPALFGGSWQTLVTQSSSKSSSGTPYLTFIVALHVATALALVIFYWSTWKRVILAFIRTLKSRKITDPDERLAWLLIVGTIPVGIIGIVLEKPFRELFAKPLAAAVFLFINGLILLLGEYLRRRPSSQKDRKLTSLSLPEGAAIGSFQVLALLAGISRSGISMVGGLVRGLNREDAANFAFLLATPVIFGAGLYKLPSLAGHAGHAMLGQLLVGALAAGIAAYLSVRYLTKYFQTKTLLPFAIYCLVAGVFFMLRFSLWS